MKKKQFHYEISGYRWSPESFYACKGLTKDSMKNVPLTDNERREVGILFLTKGFDAATGYVRHIDRARERNTRSIMTYGFHTKEVSGQFIYCPQLYFRSDAAIGERLYMFKKIREVLAETDGRVAISAECELDGAYNPVNVRENALTADFGRPLCIPMGSKIIRDGPEPPYRPRPKTSKKARPHKRQDSSPTR